MNAIRGVAVEQKLPICLMVGLLGKEPGVPPPIEALRPAHRRADPRRHGHSPHTCIETEDDAPHISRMIDEAWATSRPAAILIGGKPEA